MIVDELMFNKYCVTTIDSSKIISSSTVVHVIQLTQMTCFKGLVRRNI